MIGLKFGLHRPIWWVLADQHFVMLPAADLNLELKEEQEVKNWFDRPLTKTDYLPY